MNRHRVRAYFAVLSVVLAVPAVAMSSSTEPDTPAKNRTDPLSSPSAELLMTDGSRLALISEEQTISTISVGGVEVPNVPTVVLTYGGFVDSEELHWLEPMAARTPARLSVAASGNWCSVTISATLPTRFDLAWNGFWVLADARVNTSGPCAAMTWTHRLFRGTVARGLPKTLSVPAGGGGDSGRQEVKCTSQANGTWTNRLNNNPRTTASLAC